MLFYINQPAVRLLLSLTITPGLRGNIFVNAIAVNNSDLSLEMNQMSRREGHPLPGCQ